MKTTDYPYTGREGECQYDSSKKTASIKAYQSNLAPSCKSVKALVAKGVTASTIAPSGIIFYRSGVYSNPICGQDINHGVAIVGYGEDAKLNKKYWIVRNSWGKSWGDKGYIRMDMDVESEDHVGICGICEIASLRDCIVAYNV